MLTNVLSHTGHGSFKCCIVGKWTCFSFLKMFHLSSKRLLQFSLTGGELQAFKPCVGVSLQTRMGSCGGHLWLVDPTGPHVGC